MKQIIKLTLASLSILSLGCSKARMSAEGAKSPPVRKLECGPKPYITAWSGDQLLGLAIPFSKPNESSVENYDYRDYSAHPKLGPQGKEKTLSVYFFQGNDGLTFNFFLDKELGAPFQSNVIMAVTVRKNQHHEEVILSDENDEFQKVDADVDSTFFRGIFDYKLTTDGAIVGPLVGLDFEIEVTFKNKGPINNLNIASPIGAQIERAISLNSDSLLFKVVEIDPCSLPN